MAVDIHGQGRDCFRHNLESLPAALQSSATSLTVTVPSSGCHSLLTSGQPHFSDGQLLLGLSCFPLRIVRNTLLLLSPALSEEDYRAEWFILQFSFSEDTSTLVWAEKRGRQVSTASTLRLSLASLLDSFLPTKNFLQRTHYPYLRSCLKLSFAYPLASGLSDNCLCMNVYVGTV